MRVLTLQFPQGTVIRPDSLLAHGAARLPDGLNHQFYLPHASASRLPTPVVHPSGYSATWERQYRPAVTFTVVTSQSSPVVRVTVDQFVPRLLLLVFGIVMAGVHGWAVMSGFNSALALMIVLFSSLFLVFIPVVVISVWLVRVRQDVRAVQDFFSRSVPDMLP